MRSFFLTYLRNMGRVIFVHTVGLYVFLKTEDCGGGACYIWIITV